jgi:hypothetical protein
MDYNKEVLEKHPLFIKNKDKINKYGIDQFLKDIGIFGKIVPFVKPPNNEGLMKLIGYNIDFEYRLNEMKDEKHYKMDIIDDFDTFPTKNEAGDAIILRAFEIINNNSYIQDKIEKLNY